MRDAAIDIAGVDLFSSSSGTSRPSRRSLGSLICSVTSSPLSSRPDHASGSFKGKFLERPGRAIRKPREAACAVAAHLGFAAVGVVIAHPEIGPVCRTLQHEHAIRAHAAMPIAKAGNLTRASA